MSALGKHETSSRVTEKGIEFYLKYDGHGVFHTAETLRIHIDKDVFLHYAKKPDELPKRLRTGVGSTCFITRPAFEGSETHSEANATRAT